MTSRFEMYVVSVSVCPEGGSDFAGVITGLDDVFIGRCEGELWVDGQPVRALHINGEGIVETWDHNAIRLLSASETVDAGLVAEPWRCRIVGHYEEGNTPRKAWAVLGKSIREYAVSRSPKEALRLLAEADEIIKVLPENSRTDSRYRARLAGVASALRELYSATSET
jgi:hypothetical protein